MKQNLPLTLVRQIMTDFAKQTGLSPVRRPPSRYLWTDAFAVCNLLELYRQTGDDSFKSLALSLVDQVHETLGRHRQDDRRQGWISGLGEDEGRLHPTAGGMRIGKEMNERGPTDPFDERMEWERDGQYYHYLIKWMHALQCVATATSEGVYSRWARELAKKVHGAFVFSSADGQKYIHWKMSIDLSRPLIPSMGLHDPLEGFILYSQLQADRSDIPQESPQLDLSDEIKELAGICRGRSWATEDPLGIGGLLCNGLQVAQLMVRDRSGQDKLLLDLLDSSLLGLESYLKTNTLLIPARYRLAFREFGLSIGLHAVERLKELLQKKRDSFKESVALHRRIEELMGYQPVGEQIERFWQDEANREVDTWLAHRGINMVMQATSLAPDGFLQVP
ncbi:MAG: hypothetical protein KJ990_02290 [Proteobacteria bacterium]|nr:hypothetical protein [Pseudomonadota bacterium]MBU1649300.1 hypothetical protein [Pseudomonadota bacterium]